YQFNPRLSVRCGQGEKENWEPIYAALNLPLINEFARYYQSQYLSSWDQIKQYCAMANMPNPTIPIAAEREMARRGALPVTSVSKG
ncbi:hypothetical protein, partial [Ferrovum sp.]|uniref:hypothetical protein n=1 Tax=Ferrovum sp. TaxID=2609467 RepID=UPI00262DA93E